jgi:hypothetical protein
MRFRSLFAAFCLSTAALVPFLGCGKATPVAPAGTTIQLTISPSIISAHQTASVQALVRRENGTPVNPGTIVLFASTLGTITPSAATDSQGIAVGTLKGDGRLGTAKVTATSGPVTTDAVEVQIGVVAATVTLSATPSSVSESGGKVNLLALVRDANGQPLADALVNFRSDLGTLASGGAFLHTSADGQAKDTLTVSAADVATLSGDSFSVHVQASGSGAVVTDDQTIAIERKPRASFDVTLNPGALSAVFKDTSTGNPTKWSWDFGDGTPLSTQQNPVHVYGHTGTFVVTLTVSNANGDSSQASAVVQFGTT